MVLHIMMMYEGKKITNGLVIVLQIHLIYDLISTKNTYLTDHRLQSQRIINSRMKTNKETKFCI